jgi:hypothetical protein
MTHIEVTLTNRAHSWERPPLRSRLGASSAFFRTAKHAYWSARTRFF